ncbi:hypothetical protein MTO96_048128 [Rhipicephalus appendiculatus]
MGSVTIGVNRTCASARSASLWRSPEACKHSERDQRHSKRRRRVLLKPREESSATPRRLFGFSTLAAPTRRQVVFGPAMCFGRDSALSRVSIARLDSTR